MFHWIKKLNFTKLLTEYGNFTDLLSFWCFCLHLSKIYDELSGNINDFE